MRGFYLILFGQFFLTFCYSCSNAIPDPEPIKIHEPVRGDTTSKAVMIRIDGEQQLFVGSQKISYSQLDSVIRFKKDSLAGENQSLTILINPDSAAIYGNVFQAVRAAKKAGAKVVVNVAAE
jgi:biopolymer transport protein ExbD